MAGRCLDRIVFKQVEQEMQENSWRFASAPHTSVSPVLHAKNLKTRGSVGIPCDVVIYDRVTRQRDGISFGYGDPCGVMARTREQEGKAK